MIANPAIAAVLVDWGTSRLRLWAVDGAGTVLGEARSGEGMGATEPRAFEGILEHHLAELGAGPKVPVMMCGMVGSRQGWQEAPYVEVPARLETIIERALPVSGTPREVRILPGIADRSVETPDVMRSEETQLLGLSRIAGNGAEGLVCMPGTHAKWVLIGEGGTQVSGFATALTGDLFAALSRASVLRHSLSGDAGLDGASFDKAVRAAIDEPARMLMRLFAIRSRALLHGADAAHASASLSGTIIGQDIAGALARFGKPERLTLVGGGTLGALYARALDLVGIATDVFDGEELARAGLFAAAVRVWPDMFATAPPATAANP
ncbi:2-dehydro-3-deoxygalactonokinase [Oceaniradius stylonematis]|uniref:2-dehydro-3-deoxygalactonokinase n=1 Tax=Oceaniradius stylonematis TaxID=2184161 RepID=UPI00273E25D2|nr:2-dehydro-3-deoxygalactonokinase [Oceaniradius stylonematis]